MRPPLRGDTVIIYSMSDMCAGIEYLRDGERVCVYLARRAWRCPCSVAMAESRSIVGRAPPLLYADDDNLPGQAKRFPEEHCARLEGYSSKQMGELRTAAGAHPGLSLHPVQSCDDGTVILPAETRRVHSGPPGNDKLPPARVCRYRAAPAEYADRWPEWPRIVRVASPRVGAVHL